MNNKLLLQCVVSALVIVGVLFSFDVLRSLKNASRSTHSHQQGSALVVEPQNILYSRAYKTERGANEIEYAYLSQHEPEMLPNEDLLLRTPTSQTVVEREFANEFGDEVGELRTVFSSRPQFYQDDLGEWKQIEYATTTQETFSRSGATPYIVRREAFERVLGIPPVFALTSTFYPNADAESTSVDGHIAGTGTSSTSSEFQEACIATTGTVTDSATTIGVLSNLNYFARTGNYTGSVRRAFLLFDTSALTSSATISSATLSIYVTATTNGDNDGDDTINVITTTPASNTGLVSADFDNVGTTLQASAQDITSIGTSAYLDFSLNATGRGNISKTSVTKFGLREGHDLACSDPVSGSIGNSVTFSSAEESGTSQDPKLVVVYTLPAAEIEIKRQSTFWFD